VNDVNQAVGGIERDKARSAQRRATQLLQNAQRIDRNKKEAQARAKKRRRVDWNVAVF
jgi:hypothetical protein